MSDYKSGLPIRSEADGTDEKVIVKIVDGQSGGTNQMQIDSDKNAHVEIHGNQPTTGTDIALLLSETGRVNPDGDYDVTTNTKPASIGLIVHDRATSPSETDQNFRPTGVQGTALDTVHALDISLHDEKGDAYSEANPLAVSIVDSEGDEINDYKESVANVNAGATDTHVFTAAAASKITQLHMTASGRAKFLVEVDPTGAVTYTKKFVFFNSTAKPDCDITLKEPIALAIGGTVRITRQNNDNQPMFLYSTISGHTVT